MDWSPATRVLRVFGASVIATGLALGLVLHFAGDAATAAAIVFAVLGVLGIVPLVAPATRLARWIYVVVSVPALLIGNVVSVVLVTVVYFVVVTPIGLIARAVRDDPLAMELDAEAASYWVESEDQRPPESYERQF